MKKIIKIVAAALSLCLALCLMSCSDVPGGMKGNDPFDGTEWYMYSMCMLRFKDGKYYYGTYPYQMSDTYSVKKKGGKIVAECKYKEEDVTGLTFEVESADAMEGDLYEIVGTTKVLLMSLERED